MARRRKNGLDGVTGADLVILAADEVQQAGAAYAKVFYDMAWQGVIGSGVLPPTLASTIAERSLRDDEATPVAAVSVALQMAIELGDDKVIADVVLCGAVLIAKWAEYLNAALPEGHPVWSMEQKTSVTGASGAAVAGSTLRCASCGAEYIARTVLCAACMGTDLRPVTEP